MAFTQGERVDVFPVYYSNCNACDPLYHPLELPWVGKTTWPAHPFLKGCLARNCVECHPHNPGSCLNCSQGFYLLQKKIMGNVRCVRHCPMGFTPTVRNDGEKFCKDAHSSKRYEYSVYFSSHIYILFISYNYKIDIPWCQINFCPWN